MRKKYSDYLSLKSIAFLHKICLKSQFIVSLAFCLLFFISGVKSQQIISLNLPLEALSNVTNCAGSPDQCPMWGTPVVPFSGAHFIGIHEMNYTYSGEAISAKISQPLVSGKTYTYQVMATIAPITAWGGTNDGDRDGVIYVYAGTAACSRDQLIDSITLFTPADRNNWRLFTFNFTATGNYTDLSFLTRKKTSGGYAVLSYMGLDDIKYDFGDAPDSYKALFTSNGPRHSYSSVFPAVCIGNVVDADEEGSPNTTSIGDDNSGLDDEDGFVTLPDLNLAQNSYTLTSIPVKNNSGKSAYLAGWIDFNKNGTFDPSEASCVQVPSTGAQTVTLSWNGYTIPSVGTTYARFRITTDTNITQVNRLLCSPVGIAADGEVEDYKVNITNVTILPPVCNFQSSDTIICTNDCISFADKSSGATSWRWSFQGAVPATSTDQNPPLVCYMSPGNYSVTQTAFNSGGSDTLTITNYIKVIASPPVPTIVKSNDTLYCSVDTSYISYQWFYNTSLLSGATTSKLAINNSGNYNVQVANESGCKIAVGINIVLGVQHFMADNSISLYPNPAGNRIIANGLPFAIERIEIYNVLGQPVYIEQQETVNKKQETSIDVSLLPPGVYFIQLIGEKERWQGKFVKK